MVIITSPLILKELRSVQSRTRKKRKKTIKRVPVLDHSNALCCKEV